VSRGAPPAGPGALAWVLRPLAAAALGGLTAFLALLVAGQAVGLLFRLLLGVYGVVSWAKIGLLVSLLSLRAEVEATMPGSLQEPGRLASEWRFVPFGLTLVFVWLAAGAGRRAVARSVGRSPAAVALVAAAGAAVPVAILAGVLAPLVRLSFPTFGMHVEVDPATAVVGGAVVTAAAAAVGSLLEAREDAGRVAAIRGALTGYGVALLLLIGVALVVAALEPRATGAYVDGLRGAGANGGALFGIHVLALPAQAALHLVPAAGSCLAVAADGPALELCPWSITVTGPAGGILLAERLALSPWLWLSNAIPVVAAAIAGRHAASAVSGRSGLAFGASAGLLFAILAVVAAWFVAPRLFLPVAAPVLVDVTVEPAWGRTALALAGSGLAGGILGGWLGRRR
jgi:hypothetical protein